MSTIAMCVLCVLASDLRCACIIRRCSPGAPYCVVHRLRFRFRSVYYYGLAFHWFLICFSHILKKHLQIS